MGRQRGPKVRRRQSRRGGLDAVGRVLGFLMVAGSGMGLLACVVLLPPYASLAQAEYDLRCRRASVDDAEAHIQANDRLIASLPTNQVLTKRLAESQLPVTPQHEVIIPAASIQKRPPDLIVPQRCQRPSPPPKWLMRAARRLSKPPTRRGLLLLALGALITAVYLFTPPQWPSKKS